MDKPVETYRFTLESWDRDRIPMARLAKYMDALARLLGHPESVHFQGLEDGSLSMVQVVERQAVPGVLRHVREAMAGTAPSGVLKARKDLEKYLAEDGGTGRLSCERNSEELVFCGAEAAEEETFGPISEETALDGVIFRVGGTGDPVPVHFMEEDTVRHGEAPRALARELAQYLFGDTVRLHGEASWKRTAKGEWLLEEFRIQKFEELDPAPLWEVIGKLRTVEGSGWPDIEDPVAEIRRLRGLD